MRKYIEFIPFCFFILFFCGCSDDGQGRVGQRCKSGEHVEVSAVYGIACIPDGKSACDLIDCSKVIDGWENGNCKSSICYVEKCVDGYHVDNNRCEPDTTDACGAPLRHCIFQVDHWEDGVCEHGQCVVKYCVPGYHVENNVCVEDPAICDGSEVDLSSNNQHCGACHHPCTDGRLCVNGQCKFTEDSVLVCSGITVNPSYDSANCGG